MAQGVGALMGLFVLLWCTMVQGEFSLTLLHTANTDSQVLAVGQFNGPCTPTNFTQGNDSYVADPANMPCVGGVARRAALIKSIRASVENSLLIDGGYLFTGSVFWTLFGTEMLGQYYQEMGYDAIKIDLFEFFGGVDQLAKFIGMVPNTRVVAANLVGKNDSRLANATIVPYAIFTFASGDKVGYAATLVAQVGTRFENSQGINSFDELSGMLQAVGSMLNQGVNKIIVSVSDISMLDSVINFVPGIDIVILPNALYANDEGIHEVVLGPYPQIRYMAWDGYASAEKQPLLVVATGPFGRRLGRLDVTFDDNGVLTSWGGDSILLYSSIEADYQVQQLILSQMAQVEASSSKVVGRAAVDINWRDSCVFGECAIGDWIAEVFRNITGTRIGMVNGGALYGPFAKGDISLGQYLVVFPFGWNFLYTLTLKGENLIAALDNSVSLADQTNLPLSAGTGRFLSVAGLRFTWNPELPVGRRVVDVWVEEDGQWEILDHQQFYSITTLDFVAKGGDSYDNLATNALGATSTQITAATAIEAALAKSLLQPINASVDGRIALSNGTRMTCVAPNMEICSNNGYCQTGVCQCTVVEAAGPYCIIGATTNGTSSASRVAQLVAIVVPAVGVVVIVLLIASVLCAMLIFRLTRKKKEEWDVNFDELELEDRLGEGSFGEVYKGKWKGTEVAVKVMTPGLVTKEMKNNFVDEMRVMSALRHPNVVLFMGASSRSPRMCIIMEYMALGSLYDVLHNDLVPSISMSLSLKIALRAAKGMHFLHSSGIVHRDLKSLNLLLDSKWNVKVSDFGLGKFKAHIKASDGHIGSIPWTAPEVLAEQPDTDFMMADVFSFAVVLFEIVTRRNPYEHLNAAAIAVGVLRDDMRPTTHIGEDALKEVPGQYVALMRNCWHTDAQMRPTFLEIMTRLEYLVDEFPAVDSRPYSLGSTTSFLPPNAGRGSDGDEDYDESYEYRADEDAHDEDARELSEVERDRPQLGAGGAKPPHGEMVIGFTDIANGAALWERDAPAMRDATLVHNDILRKLTNKHGGYEAALTAIGNHGEGAFCVAFQRSVDAIGWATEVQNALLKADWPATLLACPEAAEERDDSKGLLLFRGPRVRMGFHFGRPRAVREPVYRSIQYAGEVVKCAARLAGLAQGGQVLVTERLRRDLAVSSGEVGLALSRRLQCAGRIVLPDSIDKERVFEVRVEGLEARFFSNEATTVSSSSSSSSPSSADSQLLSGSTTRIHRDPFGASTEISFPLPEVGTYARDESAGVRGDTDGEEEESYLSPSQVSLERDVFLTSANLCRWIIRYEDLSLHKQVGVGSYGLVYLARWKGVDVAVKRFIKQKLTERRMLEFRAEVALLAELHHPNIVLFIGACVRSPDLCIVTEFVARGCLRTILSDATVKLSWQQRLRMLRGAALGISYLHSLEPIILHRDLKSSNLLVDEVWNVKVADFGFARIKEENATMTRCGTPCWTAPEVIRGEKYSEKADVYSFGVVVWEVLTRKLPYAGHTFMSVALEILDGKRPEVPAECPPFIADLMQRCWHKREDKRPTMEEVSASLEAQLTGGGGDNV